MYTFLFSKGPNGRCTVLKLLFLAPKFIRLEKIVRGRCACPKNFLTFCCQLRCAILEISSYAYYFVTSRWRFLWTKWSRKARNKKVSWMKMEKKSLIRHLVPDIKTWKKVLCDVVLSVTLRELSQYIDL